MSPSSMDTGKLMELVLTEVRELGARVTKLDTSMAGLVVELRATQKADQASMAVLSKDVEDLKDAVEALKNKGNNLELEQVKIKAQLALPVSVVGLLTAIAAVVAQLI